MIRTVNNYYLLNVDNEEIYEIKTTTWVEYIEKAKSEGWKPDGTLYDQEFRCDDECIFEDVEENLFRYLQIHDEQFHWDGNYIEKCNQLIDNVDAYYLGLALEGIAEKDLIDFLQRGSIRICS